MYKIELIASFLDHQCVNPKHSITQKQTVKSHHNTKSSQRIPANARTKTTAYKKHYELKEICQQIHKSKKSRNSRIYNCNSRLKTAG
jgi:hypothetical protein